MTALQEFENLIYPNDLNRVFVHLAESLRISRFRLTGLNYAIIFDDDYFRTDFPSMFEFKHWPELEEELSVGIKLRVSNPSELSLYIGSILKSLAPAAKFFFKRSEDDALPALFEMVNSPYYAAIEIPPVICEIIKNDPQPCVAFHSDQEKEEAGEEAIKHVKESIPGARTDFPFMAASQAYSNLVHVGAYIESVLLECGQKKRLKDYQEEAGVSISDKSLLEQVALIRHWSVEHIEELLKKKGKGGKHAVGHSVGDVAPIDPLDPLYVSKWDSLSLLLVKQYSANQYLLYGGEEPDMEWERMEGENYDLFDRDVNTLVGDPIRVRQACLVIIQRPLYWFIESNKKRHEYKGDKSEFFVRSFLMLMKYMARVIGKTLSLDPSACFFQLSEELGFTFDDFFNTSVDYQSSYKLGLDPRLFLRFRADQCSKCNKQECKYRIDDPANYDFGPKGELKRVNYTPVQTSVAKRPLLKKGNPPADMPVSGVDEVDNLGFYYFQAPVYAKYYAQEDRDNFRKLCYAKAEDKLLSVEEKKIWILRVLQTIETAYALAQYGDDGEKVIQDLARSLAVVLECTFMAVFNPICVKRIGMENDLSLIFRETIDWDKDHPLDDEMKAFRFYDIQGEIGANVAYFERRMCNACEIKSCPYRYIISKDVEVPIPDDCPEDHIKNLTGYEMDEEEPGEGGSAPVVTFAPLEDPLSRAESYLKALYPRFVNENYKWKKGLDGCTLYHAYWAAFIIKQTFQELTIASIGDLFGINSLRSYGTFAKTRNTYKVAIVDQFKNAKLSIPELPALPES